MQEGEKYNMYTFVSTRFLIEKHVDFGEWRMLICFIPGAVIQDVTVMCSRGSTLDPSSQRL